MPFACWRMEAGILVSGFFMISSRAYSLFMMRVARFSRLGAAKRVPAPIARASMTVTVRKIWFMVCEMRGLYGKFPFQWKYNLRKKWVSASYLKTCKFHIAKIIDSENENFGENPLPPLQICETANLPPLQNLKYQIEKTIETQQYLVHTVPYKYRLYSHNTLFVPIS